MDKFNTNQKVITQNIVYSKGQCFSIPKGSDCKILATKKISETDEQYLINKWGEELVITFWCGSEDIKQLKI